MAKAEPGLASTSNGQLTKSQTQLSSTFEEHRHAEYDVMTYQPTAPCRKNSPINLPTDYMHMRMLRRAILPVNVHKGLIIRLSLRPWRVLWMVKIADIRHSTWFLYRIGCLTKSLCCGNVFVQRLSKITPLQPSACLLARLAFNSSGHTGVLRIRRGRSPTLCHFTLAVYWARVVFRRVYK